jgi:hypothetical protein
MDARGRRRWCMLHGTRWRCGRCCAWHAVGSTSRRMRLGTSAGVADTATSITPKPARRATCRQAITRTSKATRGEARQSAGTARAPVPSSRMLPMLPTCERLRVSPSERARLAVAEADVLRDGLGHRQGGAAGVGLTHRRDAAQCASPRWVEIPCRRGMPCRRGIPCRMAPGDALPVGHIAAVGYRAAVGYLQR